MRCHGIVPEETVVVTPEKAEVVTREEVVQEDGQDVTKTYEEIQITPAEIKIIPEHKCKEEATILSRSMKQETCNLGGTHWVKDGPDKVYCYVHNQPGKVTDANGTVSLHPAMHISEYKK